MVKFSVLCVCLSVCFPSYRVLAAAPYQDMSQFVCYHGVFTLAVSRTGTGTGKNGLYDIMQNVSHYTRTGTGTATGKNTNGCYTHFSGPENLPCDEL